MEVGELSATHHQFNPYLMHQSVQGGQIWLLGTGRPKLPHSQLIPNPTPPIPRAHSSLLVNKVTSSFPGIALRKSISHKHDGHKQRAAWTCVGSPLHVWAHASPHSESGCPHALLADVTQAQPSPQSYDRRYPFVAMFWVKTS